MIRFSQYSYDEQAELCDFHKKSYGEKSYHSKAEYLNWLYQSDVHDGVEPLCWIARDSNNAIIGCIHIMYLPASSKHMDRRIDIHSLQNLIVDEESRAGVGVLLVKRALKNCDIAIFPGVASDLAKTYHAMKYQEVPSFWGRKILNPFGVAKGMIYSKLHKSCHIPKKMRVLLDTHGSPDNQKLLQLRERLTSQNEYNVEWSIDNLRWRFFSEIGPKHLLYLNENNPEQYAVISVGMKQNICVVRFIEFGDDIEFLKNIVTDLKKNGAHIAMGYATGDNQKMLLRDIGLDPVPNMPTSFLKYSPKMEIKNGFHLTAGHTDVGFEGIGI